MNTTSKLLAAALFGSVAIFGTAYAQTDSATTGSTPPPDNALGAPVAPPTKNADAWVLGRTYIQADGSIEKFNNSSQTATGASPGLGLNLPLGDYFDYGLHYAYEHAANNAFKLNDNTLETGFTAYDKMGGFAPFVTADLGYAWDRSTNSPAPSRFDHALYDISVGVEVPVSQSVSLRTWAGHDSSFRSPHQNDWSYSLAANSWINNVLGIFVGAGWKSGYLGSHSSVAYLAGLRIALDSE